MAEDKRADTPGPVGYPEASHHSPHIIECSPGADCCDFHGTAFNSQRHIDRCGAESAFSSQGIAKSVRFDKNQERKLA